MYITNYYDYIKLLDFKMNNETYEFELMYFPNPKGDFRAWHYTLYSVFLLQKKIKNYII